MRLTSSSLDSAQLRALQWYLDDEVGGGVCLMRWQFQLEDKGEEVRDHELPSLFILVCRFQLNHSVWKTRSCCPTCNTQKGDTCHMLDVKWGKICPVVASTCESVGDYDNEHKTWNWQHLWHCQVFKTSYCNTVINVWLTSPTLKYANQAGELCHHDMHKHLSTSDWYAHSKVPDTLLQVTSISIGGWTVHAQSALLRGR